MEKDDEELAVSPTSDETLSHIRELSIRCRELLHQLSAEDGSTDGAEARELMAGFNIWVTNMGVFRDGQQSITSRLKSAPQISELVQQLLAVLERDLEKASIHEDGQEGISSASESDDSSDRSSTSSYRLLSSSDDDEDQPPLPPQFTIWTSIQETITSLRQLALTVRLAGARHRQERIQRFKNLDRNKQVYQQFEKCARQTVDFRFPKASECLRERMAESIATRRARFLYLEQHQKKTSTLSKPAPDLQRTEAPENEGNTLPKIQPGQHQAGITLPAQSNFGPSVQPSVMLSATENTEYDRKQLLSARNKTKRAESVSSVKISMGTLPSIPKLDPGGTSFTCPYCFLVCPSKEVSGQNQWMSHLIHDFEPFFCVFDDCSSPFTCADTYSGWLAHMRDIHTQPEWHCWHCKTASPFLSPAELERHLERHHQKEVTDSLRPTLIKHSMVRDQHALQDCPFCGGFPEEIEKEHLDRDRKQAREALEKHVRDHLVSVALILAPVGTEEPGGQLDDTQSDAQRGTDSERDLGEVADTYELECRNYSCDCKESKKNSVLDWSTAPGHLALEMEDMQMTTQLWQDILDKKTGHQGEDETLLDFAANFTQNPSRREFTRGQPLFTELDQRLRTCPLEDRPAVFLPADELDNITVENIEAELAWKTKFFSPRLSHKVASEAKRVFCVLVLIEKPAAIEQLIKEGITDEDLPLCRNAHDENDSEYNVLVSVGSNKRFPSTMSWRQRCKVDDFLRKQWVVLSPIFDKPRSHFVLDPKCALPLIECKTETAKGGIGVVHKARLHPAHQHLFKADAQAYVAIKEIHNKEDFIREKNNLDIIQSLQNRHLISLLASCERGSTYYLLFPWANGGTLRDFWEEQDSKPRTLDLIRWALEQILGLVDGIHALHNRNKRHGDIKPQNIHVFEEPKGTNSAALVLAGMSVPMCHEETISLRRAATMTTESKVSYEAPEAGSDQRNYYPRSRRYDMWSAGCMFLDFTLWLVYDVTAVDSFHEQNKHQNYPFFFFSREPNQLTEIHPAVTEAIRHLRDHPLCKDGTALGDLVTLINDRLLQIQPEDRAKAAELYDRVKAIVDAAAAKPEYLGQEKFDDPWKFLDDSSFAIQFLSTQGTRLARPSPPPTASLCKSCAHLSLLVDGVLMKGTFSSMKALSETCQLHDLILRACAAKGYQETSVVEVRRVGPTLKINGEATSALSICRGLADRADLGAAPGSPGDIHIGLPQLPQVNSALFYDLMLHWLRDCDLNHPECRPLNDPEFLPTRLLDVSNNSVVHLRMTKEGGLDMSRDCRYIVLSHRWGDGREHNRFFTTLENIPHRLHSGIAVSQLPDTFKHAVQVTRALNVRYLWIDSLCIIQDVVDDLHTEAKNMESIFSSAYCVISASRASGTSSGFLGERPARRFIRFDEAGGTPHYVCEAIDDFQHDVIEGDFNTQGWVFQERALARRTIYFTKNQTYWECGHGVRCETLARMTNNEAAFLGDPNFPDLALRSSKGGEIRFYQWLYERYSRLDFTMASDRPIAIAGLERRLVNAFDTHGGYGVFEGKFFGRSLLWIRDARFTEKLEKIDFPSSQEYVVPTWSWMAHKGPITFMPVPFDTVEWEGGEDGIRLPWTWGDSPTALSTCHTGNSNERTDLTAYARDLEDLASAEKGIIYDQGHTGLTSDRVKCVVVGREKLHDKPADVETPRLYYVLLVTPISSSGNEYGRVGAASLPGTCIAWDRPALRVRIF